MPYYIFVVGGVMSGIGKGVATSCIAKTLQARGFKITAIKIDPYINVDAGTMNPLEHGEIFVMDDGTECDQDIGNYERFLNISFTNLNYITTGKVYQTVIKKERNLEYKGICVEVVPHIPNEAIRRIKNAAKSAKADFVLIEIGGTVGEYQNMLFLEAARMMKLKEPKQVFFVLISYLPVPPTVGEMKTKPTQHAVKFLNMAGIQPDFILARSNKNIDKIRKKKISIFCNIKEENIISSPDAKTIYEVPLLFEKEKISEKILKKCGLKSRQTDLKKWKKLVKKIKKSKKTIKIGIIGKYFESGNFILTDVYISVIEAIKHSCWYYNRKPEISWIFPEKYEKKEGAILELKKLNGVIVPGGFGKRGTEGKIKAIRFCRENKIPYLGICLGGQLAIIEFARNVCKMKNANSTEFDKKTEYPIIDIINEQKIFLAKKDYGATMRLGSYNCLIKKGTNAYNIYKKAEWQKKEINNNLLIEERHRHRYEFNNSFKKRLEEKGLIFSGINLERDLVEIVEIKNHPFFIAVQFHPEFKSRPLNPHPLFNAFIKAANNNFES